MFLVLGLKGKVFGCRLNGDLLRICTSRHGSVTDLRYRARSLGKKSQKLHVQRLLQDELYRRHPKSRHVDRNACRV